MAYLKQFFAVTTTALYRIIWNTTTNHLAVTKIALVGESDRPVDDDLMGGFFLGIAKHHLIKYGTTHRVPLEEVSTSQWGETTFPIVGLFREEHEARRCLNSGGLAILDPRWQSQTEATIKAIGPNHPGIVFSIDDPIQYD